VIMPLSGSALRASGKASSRDAAWQVWVPRFAGVARGCLPLDQLGGIWEITTLANPAELSPTGLKWSL
jgi:hypothetical protein